MLDLATTMIYLLSVPPPSYPSRQIQGREILLARRRGRVIKRWVASARRRGFRERTGWCRARGRRRRCVGPEVFCGGEVFDGGRNIFVRFGMVTRSGGGNGERRGWYCRRRMCSGGRVLEDCVWVALVGKTVVEVACEMAEEVNEAGEGEGADGEVILS